MLPTLEIELDRSCRLVREVFTDQIQFPGQTYAFHYNPAIESAQIQSKSLDRLITEVVLDGMTENPIKSQVIFWYSAIRDMLFLTSCELHRRFDPVWLRRIAGYMESGSDFVPENARPYLYWNGDNLTRVYPPCDDWESGQTYLCDLGSLPRYSIGPGVDFAVDAVRATNPDYTAYSIVPEEPQQIITVGNRKCVLMYAFYRLRFMGEPYPEP